MATSPKATETRDLESLRRHYETEKRLAAKLRAAPAAKRRSLYSAVYDELYRTVEDHPTANKPVDPARIALKVDRHMRFLNRFVGPDTRFLEIGPGSCALSLEMCRHVSSVIAVDVSSNLPDDVTPPENFSLVIAEGGEVDLPDSSVDVAFSHQVIEHLHPDDAREQIRRVYRALSPGSVYACVTPNGLNGPHDISMYFADEPEGMHLKEWTNAELVLAFRDAGFREAAAYVGRAGRYMKLPVGVVTATEAILRLLPRGIARRVAGLAPFRALLGIRIVARK